MFEGESIWLGHRNTEGHVDDIWVVMYHTKKEGTAELHTYVTAVGNTEAGGFPCALPDPLPSPFQLFLPKRFW